MLYPLAMNVLVFICGIVTHRLLEMLRPESGILDRLNSLGLEPAAHSALLAIPVHKSESNQVVLDVRSKSVVVRKGLKQIEMSEI